MAKSKQNSINFLDYRKKNYSYIKIAVIFVCLLTAGAAIYGIKQKQKPKVASSTVVVPQVSSTTIPGWWYQQYFGASVCNEDKCKPDADPDHDGLNNQQEYYYKTDPTKAHTVGDKLNDGQLVAQNFDPSKKGHLTFEQAGSDDEILGEGLAFNNDISKLINEEVNLNLTYPVIDNSELKISSDNSKKAIIDYLDKSDLIVHENFPNGLNEIQNYSNTPDQINQIQKSSSKTVQNLKNLPVPPAALQAHKDLIILIQLLPKVLAIPDKTVLEDNMNPVGNQWYDNSRIYFSVLQKITMEIRNIQNQYK
jgi:hypothetical protein